MNKYTTEVLSPAVLAVRFKGIKAGWEQWILLSADRHHDSIHCDRRLEREHLELAKERGALICDFGDLFCAMQGKYDKRSKMDDIRPEDVRTNYLDSIVNHAAEDYGPYARYFLLIGKGNHEDSVRTKHGKDLIDNLVHRLNSKPHHGNVAIGGYGGWISFRFTHHKTSRTSCNLKYFHGSGGGGPVTRGVIQTNRQAVIWPDADIAVGGHTHDAWIMPISRERLSQSGKQGRDLIHFVRTPGYKDEYADGSGGWHVTTGKPPKPIGAAWLRFYVNNLGRIDFEITMTLK